MGWRRTACRALEEERAAAVRSTGRKRGNIVRVDGGGDYRAGAEAEEESGASLFSRRSGDDEELLLQSNWIQVVEKISESARLI